MSAVTVLFSCVHSQGNEETPAVEEDNMEGQLLLYFMCQKNTCEPLNQ